MSPCRADPGRDSRPAGQKEACMADEAVPMNPSNPPVQYNAPAPLPVAPASATATPDSVTAADVAIPATPTTTEVVPPPVGDSVASASDGNADPATEQRLKDTQAWGHQKAAEAKELREQLLRIYTHPELAPIVAGTLDGTPEQGAADAELDAAYEAYRVNPDDKEAWKSIIRVSTAKARKEVATEQEQRAIARANRIREHRKQLAVFKTVSQEVQKRAPDVPVSSFWWYARRAQTETPTHLTSTIDRMAWQMDRAIQLARSEVGPRMQTATRAAAEAVAVQRTADAVMSGGGSARPESRPSTEIPPTFAEQMRALRPRRV